MRDFSQLQLALKSFFFKVLLWSTLCKRHRALCSTHRPLASCRPGLTPPSCVPDLRGRLLPTRRCCCRSACVWRRESSMDQRGDTGATSTCAGSKSQEITVSRRHLLTRSTCSPFMKGRLDMMRGEGEQKQLTSGLTPRATLLPRPLVVVYSSSAPAQYISLCRLLH